MQPGQTITPGTPQAPEPTDQTPESPAPTPPDPPTHDDGNESGWKFKGGDAGAVDASEPSRGVKSVSWTASEYVAHQRGAGWYLLLALAVVAVTVGIFFITREIITAVVIGTVGFAFGIFATRKPQVLSYEVDNKGIRIGPKLYSYSVFRSFSVLDDGGVHSILLMPAQRTGLPIMIYYELKDEVKIAEAIGANLPFEERQPAAIDRLMSKIRF